MIVIDKTGKQIEMPDGEVPDGCKLVIGASFIDSARGHFVPRLHDGRGQVAGFRPGFALVSDYEPTNSCYEDYVQRTSNAWRDPRPAVVQFDDVDDARRRRGGGPWGVPRYTGGKSAMAFERRNLVGIGAMSGDELHRERKRRLSEAWKNP